MSWWKGLKLAASQMPPNSLLHTLWSVRVPYPFADSLFFHFSWRKKTREEGRQLKGCLLLSCHWTQSTTVHQLLSHFWQRQLKGGCIWTHHLKVCVVHCCGTVKAAGFWGTLSHCICSVEAEKDEHQCATAFLFFIQLRALLSSLPGWCSSDSGWAPSQLHSPNLETPSDTHPEVCVLGDSRPS